MANLETIYLSDGKLKVKVAMRPSGSFWVEVDLPQNFADCLYNLAQSAADIQEQKMRAEILGDNNAKQ